MAMFREVADIKTADLLNLPVPEAHFENVAVPPTDEQLKMIEKLAERAEDVRNKRVEPWQDNMLKITSDGRKIGLDQRLMDCGSTTTLTARSTPASATCFGYGKKRRSRSPRSSYSATFPLRPRNSIYTTISKPS